jgi:hypothetical protein
MPDSGAKSSAPVARSPARPGLTAGLNWLGPGQIIDRSVKCLTHFCLVASLVLVTGCRMGSADSKLSRADLANSRRQPNTVLRGVHLLLGNDSQAAVLQEQLPKLASLGVNTLVLETDYNFEFKSHPELSSPGCVTRARAHKLAVEARRLGIRLIPEINCLGHQSWSRKTLSLLEKYPAFDETPGQYPNNTNLYCRSWCPQNPEVNKVVFALVDELVSAFETDAFHAGMDEVFIIGSEYCPRCKGGDPAKLLAKAVNDFHRHIVKQRKWEMFLWADRLLDAKTMGYGEWESARNGTAGAVALIPKDIVLCDWHYEPRTNYPSVPFLVEKGFRVWPAGWKSLSAAQALSGFSRRQPSNRVLGYLCTTWGAVKLPDLAEWPPLVEAIKDWK